MILRKLFVIATLFSLNSLKFSVVQNNMLKLCRRFSSFYNREIEKERLTGLFNGDKALTVLLGPPSSGKTALVKEVVESQDPSGSGPLFHPLQIDLRGTSSSSLDALYETLSDATGSFFKPLIPSSVEIKVYDFNHRFLKYFLLVSIV